MPGVGCPFLFEMPLCGRSHKVAVATLYGHANDRESCDQLISHVAGALHSVTSKWILVGDFNTTTDEGSVAGLCATGVCSALDDPFSHLGRLPGTANSDRRIDYGVACRSLFASSLSQCAGIGDHDLVRYKFENDNRAGDAVPDAEVVDRFNVQWRDQPFQDALARHDVNRAWQLLSDVGESALFRDFQRAHPRSAAWTPQKSGPRSKGARCLESLTVVQLRRLHRRVLQLSRCPDDCHLRGIIQRSLTALLDKVPVLSEFCGSNVELHVEDLAGIVEVFVQQEKAARLQMWHDKLQSSVTYQAEWIRRKSALELAFQQDCDVAPLTSREVEHVAVHPKSQVQAAETVWLDKWRCPPALLSPEHLDSIHALLAPLPNFTASRCEVVWDGASLHKLCKRMVQKAAGPDQWEAALLLKLPLTWWSAFGELWNIVYQSGRIPDRWKEARVSLVPKPGSSFDFRPLSILTLPWRLGAKHLTASLTPWVLQWLDGRILGGVCGRSVEHAHLRIWAAAQDSNTLFVAEDLSKFFDSIVVQHLQVVLDKLAAPKELQTLVGNFYTQGRRIFSAQGVIGDDWHVVDRGLVQGCPLSPLLAAAMMWSWSSTVSSPSVECLCYVDDRTFWSTSPAELQRAHARSQAVDRVFGFACSAQKCHIGWSQNVAGGQALQEMLGYQGGPFLDILGLHFVFDGSPPELLKSSWNKLLVRLMYIRMVPGSLRQKVLHVKSLILPFFCWSGGFFKLPRAQTTEVQSAFGRLFKKRLLQDTPR